MSDLPAPAPPRAPAPPPATPLRRPAVFGSLITGLAGFLDAVAFVEIDGLYVSFMSGNSMHLGGFLARMNWPGAGLACAVIAIFVAGAVLGTLVADANPSRPRLALMTCELALLGGALGLALPGLTHAALLIVALAMGMQNCLHLLAQGADVGRGFITGTLMNLGQSLARAHRDAAERRKLLPLASSWLAFVAGAIAGTLVIARISLAAALAMAIAALIGLIAALRAGRL